MGFWEGHHLSIVAKSALGIVADHTPVNESVRPNNNHPTSQLEQVIALYQNSDVRVSDIIGRADVGKHELYSALDAPGVARHSDFLAKQRKERAQQSRALYEQGSSVRDISAALGVSIPTMYRDLRAESAPSSIELFSNQELRQPYATLQAA